MLIRKWAGSCFICLVWALLLGLAGPAAAADPVSLVVDPELGGTLSLTNDQGDVYTLTIPAGALVEETMVTLTPLTVAPTNPFATNLSPGVGLEPTGAALYEAASLTVSLAQAPPVGALLVYCYQPDLALPLADQTVTGNVLTGSGYAVGQFTVVAPTSAEADAQAAAAVAAGTLPFARTQSGGEGYTWRGTHTLCSALLSWAQFYLVAGNRAKADQMVEEAVKVISEAVTKALDQPIPTDPCGEYMTNFVKLAYQSMLLTTNNETAISDRINELMNRCYNRYNVEYRHNLIVDYGRYYTETTKYGVVPIWIRWFQDEAGQIEGAGEVAVSMTGQAGECLVSAVGQMSVSASGQINADKIPPTLEVTFTEVETQTQTMVCPDGGMSYDMPATTTVHEVSFVPRNGYVVEQPFVGQGGSGTYRWILYDASR